MKTRYGWMLGVVAAVLLVAGSIGLSADTAAAQKRITMKGGQIRGAYNRWTSVYAIFLTKELDGFRCPRSLRPEPPRTSAR